MMIEFSRFASHKIRFLRILKKSQNFFCFCFTMYAMQIEAEAEDVLYCTKRRLSQIGSQLRVEIEEGREPP